MGGGGRFFVLLLLFVFFVFFGGDGGGGVNGCHLILSVEWTSSGCVQSFRPECFTRKSLSLESPFSRL